jgi:hypothetical protein
MIALATAARGVPPLKIYRYFLRGLEQQMWFWGQDARHGDNLLVRYGFEHFRSSAQGSSRYRLAWRGATIELHSFCAGLYRPGTPGFLFIRGRNEAFRYEGAEPPDPECFCRAPLAIPEHTNARDPFFAALGLFLDWAEHYEVWLEALVGPRYRAGLFPYCPLPWLPPEAARSWLGKFAMRPLETHIPKRREWLEAKPDRPARAGAGRGRPGPAQPSPRPSARRGATRTGRDGRGPAVRSLHPLS